MKLKIACFVAFLVPAGLVAQQASLSSPEPADAVIDAKVDALLGQMTLDEKLGQMNQLFWDKTMSDDRIKSWDPISFSPTRTRLTGCSISRSSSRACIFRCSLDST